MYFCAILAVICQKYMSICIVAFCLFSGQYLFFVPLIWGSFVRSLINILWEATFRIGIFWKTFIFMTLLPFGCLNDLFELLFSLKTRLKLDFASWRKKAFFFSKIRFIIFLVLLHRRLMFLQNFQKWLRITPPSLYVSIQKHN